MVMGSSRLRKSIAPRRKIHILRALNTSSNPNVKRSNSVAMDAFLYIYFLKLKLEAIKREYSDLLAMKKQCLKLLKHNHIPKQEVNIKKTEEGLLAVRVRCEKQENTLVSILQVFEDMGLHVLHAKVSCGDDMSFSLDALITTVAQNHNHEADQLNANEVEKAIVKAINVKQ